MSDAWKAVIDADLKDAEYTGGVVIPDGDYTAFVSNIVAKTFRAGSKGLEVTYVLTTDGPTKGKELRDYIVIQTKDGGYNKSGPAVAKKLMMECGLTPDQILKFKFPEFDSKAFGDFKKLLEQPLLLSIKAQVQKTGENAGKSFPRVKSFKMGS